MLHFLNLASHQATEHGFMWDNSCHRVTAFHRNICIMTSVSEISTTNVLMHSATLGKRKQLVIRLREMHHSLQTLAVREMVRVKAWM